MPGAESQPLRLTVAMAASVALHALGAALLLHRVAAGDFFEEPSELPAKAELIRVSLVARPGGGGGGSLPGLPSPPTGPPDLPAVARQPPAPIRQAAAAAPPRIEPRRPNPAVVPDGRATAALRALAPPAAREASGTAAPGPAGGTGAVASLGTGTGASAGTGGGGAGTGDGSGGDGSDASARPAYGTNPKPPYPLAARRLGVEGVVTLDVVVRPDGSPAEVRVRRSSGSPLLDDSAVETVRSKWRFTPARRGATPVESRVTFPIRFALDAG